MISLDIDLVDSMIDKQSREDREGEGKDRERERWEKGERERYIEKREDLPILVLSNGPVQ